MMELSERLKTLATIYKLNETLADAIKVMQWQQSEIERLTHECGDLNMQILNLSRMATNYEMERDALKARIDGGRKVWTNTHEDGYVFVDAHPDIRPNATLILDEGVTL